MTGRSGRLFFFFGGHIEPRLRNSAEPRLFLKVQGLFRLVSALGGKTPVVIRKRHRSRCPLIRPRVFV
jgi:hypothetical protein